jgi:hypothetical protein
MKTVDGGEAVNVSTAAIFIPAVPAPAMPTLCFVSELGLNLGETR